MTTPLDEESLRQKIAQYLVSTQQDGAGLAMGRRSADGSPYKSRIVEFTDALMGLILEERQAWGKYVIGKDQAAEENIYPTEEGKKLWLSKEHKKAYRNELRAEQRQRNTSGRNSDA